MADKQPTVTNKEATPTKVASNLQKLIDDIGKLSVLELSELVKALEDQFGIQAVAAPVAVAGAPATGGEAAPVVEEKTEFTVVLTDSGSNKIGVIKAIREIKPDLSLMDAKGMVDAPPKELGTMKKEAAEEAKAKLVAAGAQVDLK